MASKKRRGSRDYVSLSYAGRRPPGMDGLQWRRAILASLRTGESPPGDVTWRWRNKLGGPVIEGSQERIVSEVASGACRPSFVALMVRRLRRDIAGMREAKALPPKPARPPFTLGTYSKTVALLRRVVDPKAPMTVNQGRRAYRHLVKLTRQRGLRPEDVAAHPEMTRRAVALVHVRKHRRKP